MIICEGTEGANICCPIGEGITITSASYGRTRPYSEVCYHGSATQENIECVADGADALIRSLCDGKLICNIPSDYNFYDGDPCGNTYKYVNVTYKCTGKDFFSHCIHIHTYICCIKWTWICRSNCAITTAAAAPAAISIAVSISIYNWTLTVFCILMVLYVYQRDYVC